MMAALSVYFLDAKCYNHFERENSIMDLYRSEYVKIEDVLDKIDIMLYVYHFLRKNKLLTENQKCFSWIFYNELMYAWLNVQNLWIDAFLKRGQSIINEIDPSYFVYDDIRKSIIIDKLSKGCFYNASNLLDFCVKEEKKKRYRLSRARICEKYCTNLDNSTLSSLLTYKKDKLRYYRYKILSKITFGKMRQHYKRKKKELKKQLKEFRRLIKSK